MAKLPHPVDVEVVAKIKARRRLLGMSQDTLGEAMGVTFQQVQKYERGTDRVSASRLSQIASTLGLPVSHFFPESRGEGASVDTVIARELCSFLETNEGRALNLAFARIGSKTIRRRILGLVTALATAEVGDDPS